jgi:hypothetical protein
MSASFARNGDPRRLPRRIAGRGWVDASVAASAEGMRTRADIPGISKPEGKKAAHSVSLPLNLRRNLRHAAKAAVFRDAQ